jgi:hypothetical protein
VTMLAKRWNVEEGITDYDTTKSDPA